MDPSQMDALFQSPPIIEAIFKHLCARDVGTCAQVCKLWKSMSALQLKQRRNIDCFFQTAKYPSRRSSVAEIIEVECAPIEGYEIEELSRSEIMTDFEYQRYLELYGTKCGFGKEVKKQIKCLSIRPSFCIAFASDSVMHNCEYLFSSPPPQEPFLKRQKTRALTFPRRGINNVLATYLPPESKNAIVVAPGVVGCCRDNTSIEVEEGYTITGLCFPETPGVKIELYDYLKCNLEDVVSEKRKAKCLLIFESRSGESRCKLNMVIDKCIKSNPNLAIGGASVYDSNKAVVFSGENVEAASIIIRKQDDKSELKNKLKSFEETGLLENRCFAFMFACVARGYQFHKEYNFESAAFHSLYPKVPLIGLFGDGEIGVNFLPPNGATPSRKFPNQRKHFYSYSTVFVLVSIKN